MRVTDQITNRMAEKSGLPIYANRGGNKNDNSLLSALNKKTSSSAYNKVKSRNEYQSMTKSANGLKDTADSFVSEEGKENIYDKVMTTGDMSEIVSEANKFIEGYNNVLSGLKGSASSLNELYFSEMKNVVNEREEYLSQIGISRDKNGKLSVDTEKLKAVNNETLRRAMEPFAEKVSFLAERISSNAKAESSSISSYYDRSGSLYTGFGSSYDYWS